MACRCSEISRCERDITAIAGDINRKLNQARDNNNTLSTKYSAFSNTLLEAVHANNLDTINQRLTSVKKKQVGYMDNIQTRRANQQTRVQNRRNSYDNEDRRYHEKTGS